MCACMKVDAEPGTMDILDVFLLLWVETKDDSSISMEQNSAKIRDSMTRKKTDVELLKYKESSSPALCSENLTLTDGNYPKQLFAKKRGTLQNSISLFRI